MNPSLLLIPDRYKASKLYSQIPDSGAGDLAFTRALDTATRVGSDGLIEKVRTNLLTFSEQFDSAAYNKSAVGINTSVGSSGIEANVAVAPNGTTTADRVNFLNQADNDLGLNRTISIAASTLFTSSFFIKGEGTDIGKQVRIKMKRATSGTSVGITNTLTLTADYVRVPTTLTMAANNVDLQFIISSNVGGAVTCLLWGAQLETGDIATPYIPTTTAAVSVGMTQNIPRIDYTGGGCGKLLLEPQRQNLLTFSEQLNNAAWSRENSTVVPNSGISPDGFFNADLVHPTTSGADRLIYQNKIGTIGQTFTSSVFVKSSGFNFVLIYAPNLGACWFNASTGVFGTVAAGVTATVLGEVNGFWRISLTQTLSTVNAYFYVGTANANGTTTSTVSGTNGILLYGCQLEASASFATSYIPTLAAAVTRSADAASKTGISALIGQTEGTLFVEFNNLQELDIPEITLDDTTNNNRIVMARNLVTAFWGIFTASAGAGGITFGTTTGNSGKFALAYSSAGYVLFRNGVQIATRTAALPVSLSAIRLNGRATSDFFGNKNVAQALLFKTRLTNAQLAELTA